MKKILGYIISVIFGILIGLFLFNEEGSSSLPDKEPDTSKEGIVIDSLMNVIDLYKFRLDSLKGSVIVIDSVRVVEIDKVIDLPISEGVELLKFNLENYEKDLIPNSDNTTFICSKRAGNKEDRE